MIMYIKIRYMIGFLCLYIVLPHMLVAIESKIDPAQEVLDRLLGAQEALVTKMHEQVTAVQELRAACQSLSEELKKTKHTCFVVGSAFVTLFLVDLVAMSLCYRSPQQADS